MTPSQRPYLSVVSYSRNDTHRADAPRRMAASYGGLVAQLEKHGLDAELVLVDWNPPADRPPLRDVLSWPADPRHVSVRIVEAGPEYQRRLPRGEKTSVYSSVASNAGIRRARGDFVVYVTMDGLYPDALIARLARRDLSEGRMYRVERIDVDAGVLMFDDTATQLAMARQHIVGRNLKNHQPLHPGLPALFTNACGDFQLMARRHWHDLHGYREDDPDHMHMDSLLAFQALGIGIEEEVFAKLALYHIDHPGGFPGLRDSGRLIGETGKTVDELWPVYRDLCIDLGLKRRPAQFNSPAWGLGNEKLPIHRVRSATWDVATGD